MTGPTFYNPWNNIDCYPAKSWSFWYAVCRKEKDASWRAYNHIASLYRSNDSKRNTSLFIFSTPVSFCHRLMSGFTHLNFAREMLFKIEENLIKICPIVLEISSNSEHTDACRVLDFILCLDWIQKNIYYILSHAMFV